MATFITFAGEPAARAVLLATDSSHRFCPADCPSPRDHAAGNDTPTVITLDSFPVVAADQQEWYQENGVPADTAESPAGMFFSHNLRDLGMAAYKCAAAGCAEARTQLSRIGCREIGLSLNLVYKILYFALPPIVLSSGTCSHASPKCSTFNLSHVRAPLTFLTMGGWAGMTNLA